VIAVAGSVTATPTGAYELYCPGTPAGNVVLNGVTTSGTISPSSSSANTRAARADLSAGQKFNLTGYQTIANIPQALAEVAQAIQADLQGMASTQIDAAGATPATTAEGPFNFDVTIPTPVPDSGVTLDLPANPLTVGPFTVTGGTPTTTTTTAAPKSSTTAPPAGGGTTTPSPVVSASSGTLAFTGPRPGLWAMGIGGAVLLVFGLLLLALIEAPRRALAFIGLMRPPVWQVPKHPKHSAGVSRTISLSGLLEPISLRFTRTISRADRAWRSDSRTNRSIVVESPPPTGSGRAEGRGPTATPRQGPLARILRAVTDALTWLVGR